MQTSLHFHASGALKVLSLCKYALREQQFEMGGIVSLLQPCCHLSYLWQSCNKQQCFIITPFISVLLLMQSKETDKTFLFPRLIKMKISSVHKWNKEGLPGDDRPSLGKSPSSSST